MDLREYLLRIVRKRGEVAARDKAVEMIEKLRERVAELEPIVSTIADSEPIDPTGAHCRYCAGGPVREGARVGSFDHSVACVWAAARRAFAPLAFVATDED